MAKQVMLTADGLRQLEEELDLLKGEKRKEIAEKIKVARSYGDLSENSEYDDAKNEQAMLEARIVTIEMIATGRQVTYTIVGSGANAANPKEGKISDESPIGAALMDKCVGDVVEVETPGGVVALKIIEISK